MPQPPAKALAVATTVAENMTEVQYWQGTKEDRLKPMMQRQIMKAADDCTRDMPKTAEDDSSRRAPMA